MEDNDTPTLAQALLACFLACTAILGLIALTTCIARAHDAARPDLTPWFESLASGKGPCCDGTDSKHLTDVEWRVKSGHYQVYLNQYEDGSGQNLWVDVPDEAVVRGPNRDGQTLVWPVWGTTPWVRCFLPGAGT